MKSHVDFLSEMIKAGFSGEPLTEHFKEELKREEASQQRTGLQAMARAAGAGR